MARFAKGRRHFPALRTAFSFGGRLDLHDPAGRDVGAVMHGYGMQPRDPIARRNFVIVNKCDPIWGNAFRSLKRRIPGDGNPGSRFVNVENRHLAILVVHDRISLLGVAGIIDNDETKIQ